MPTIPPTPDTPVSQIERVVATFDGLLQRGEIQGFAIMGAYAFMIWAEPVTTADIDLAVLVDTDEEYVQAFRSLAELGDGVEGMAVLIDGLPVEIFPTTVSDLYRGAVLNAAEVQITDKISVKVVTPEFLVLLALRAWRPKDRIRIRALQEGGVTDAEEVRRLISTFDTDGSLEERFRELD